MAKQQEVAEFFGCDPRTIRNWQRIAGFPASKGAAGYSIQDIARWRISYLEQLNRTGSANYPMDNDDEDDELKGLEIAEKRARVEERKLNIATKSFNLQVKRKLFAPITIITRTLELVSVSMSSNIDSLLPHIKRAWPDMPIEAVDVIKKVTAQCKNEIAHVEPDLSIFNSSDFESSENGSESITDSSSSNGG